MTCTREPLHDKYDQSSEMLQWHKCVNPQPRLLEVGGKGESRTVSLVNEAQRSRLMIASLTSLQVNDKYQDGDKYLPNRSTFILEASALLNASREYMHYITTTSTNQVWNNEGWGNPFPPATPQSPVDSRVQSLDPFAHLKVLYVTMNILESQVTDLNYLVESPIAPITPASTNMNGQRQSESAESPMADGTGSGKKRKSEDSSSNANGHTRAKRNRYISIAWYIHSRCFVLLLPTFKTSPQKQTLNCRRKQ
jgi:hypothetical protein